MPTRPLCICLIMHSSRSDNLGVGALTASGVEVLRACSHQFGREMEITIVDWQDARLLPAAEFPGSVLAPAFASPSEAKSYIAGMDFFMGARMHACITALLSGVPVVPMAYSLKFEGLFGSLDWTRALNWPRRIGATMWTTITRVYEAALIDLMQRADG